MVSGGAEKIIRGSYLLHEIPGGFQGIRKIGPAFGVMIRQQDSGLAPHIDPPILDIQKQVVGENRESI
jgi:hypothetical protein